MTIFGVDVSSHQPGINFAEVRREGFDFAVIKACEGDTYVNPYYGAQLAAANAAGLLTASYHFVHSADEAGQLRLLEATIPHGTPVILDAEVDGAGEYPVTVDLVRQITAAGWPVPAVYFPKWFWSQIGCPSLVGLPALWSSAYPGGTGAASAIYAAAGGDNAAGWNGYGGLMVPLYQFTDAATVAGIDGIDCTAYRGTRDQMAAFLQGDEMTPQDFLDFPLGTNENGETVTLSKVIQSIGLTPHLDTAKAILDMDLSGKNNGATLSLAAQAITGGTAKVQATIDPSAFDQALAAAVAKSGVTGVTAADVKQIVTDALATLTLKTAQ